MTGTTWYANLYPNMPSWLHKTEWGARSSASANATRVAVRVEIPDPARVVVVEGIEWTEDDVGDWGDGRHWVFNDTGETAVFRQLWAERMLIESQERRIAELEADMDQITGILAGVDTLYTETQALASIDLLPSVQAAWERGLS